MSGWEITTKTRVGKLVLPDEPRCYVPDLIGHSGFEVLPITLTHALHVWTLPDLHRDPLDQILVAQCQLDEEVTGGNITCKRDVICRLQTGAPDHGDRVIEHDREIRKRRRETAFVGSQQAHAVFLQHQLACRLIDGKCLRQRLVHPL